MKRREEAPALESLETRTTEEMQAKDKMHAREWKGLRTRLGRSRVVLSYASGDHAKDEMHAREWKGLRTRHAEELRALQARGGEAQQSYEIYYTEGSY
ncbi:hypothetical protein T484DRAFT_1844309 [Baffinella frigidus]|nr:hypothetical protein T484DRAFT_1844309 [Cryptophyta sp. CCMP2293]